MPSSTVKFLKNIVGAKVGMKIATVAAEEVSDNLDVMSESAVSTADRLFDNVAHIRSNCKEIHRNSRKRLNPSKRLGGLTEEEANVRVPVLTISDINEIQFLYGRKKNHFYKSKPSTNSQNTLDNALLASTDQIRAKIILSFIFTSKSEESDLDRVCVKFIRKKLKLDLDSKYESKFAP